MSDGGRGGFGMSPWCIVLVCSWRRLLAIAIRCPSLGPFPSVGGGAYRPHTTLCPSSSFLPDPSLSTSLSFPLAFPSIGRGAGGGGLTVITWLRSFAKNSTRGGSGYPVNETNGREHILRPPKPWMVGHTSLATSINVAFILWKQREMEESSLSQGTHGAWD